MDLALRAQVAVIRHGPGRFHGPRRSSLDLPYCLNEQATRNVFKNRNGGSAGVRRRCAPPRRGHGVSAQPDVSYPACPMGRPASAFTLRGTPLAYLPLSEGGQAAGPYHLDEDMHMLAMTEVPYSLNDPFASTLRNFLDHARAIASNKAEDDGFSWFLATEYQWEVENACETLIELPTNQVSPAERAVLCKFLIGMPAVRDALKAFKQNIRNHPELSSEGEWTDWEDVSALPAWRDFSIRTAIVLSQLGKSAQNEENFFGSR
jgi:hypothetical protein